MFLFMLFSYFLFFQCIAIGIQAKNRAANVLKAFQGYMSTIDQNSQEYECGWYS
jgi:hypothetical protein